MTSPRTSVRALAFALTFLVSMPVLLSCVSSDAKRQGMQQTFDDKAHETYRAILADKNVACATCMNGELGACESLQEFPLVALARNRHVIRDVSNCKDLRNQHPGDDIHCSSFESARFSQLEILKHDGAVSARAVFRTLHEYDYWMPEKLEGVRLIDEHTYLIFARPASDSIPLEADWDVSAACHIG